MIVKINKEISGLNKEIYYCLKNKEILLNYNLSNYYNFNILNKIIDKKYNNLNKEYKKILNKLNASNVNWSEIIGRNNIKKRAKNIISDISNIDENDIKYFKVLSERYEFTSKIVKPVFKSGIEEAKPVYDHNSTITGRSVIKKGYNFLTSKKTERSNLVSRYVLGSVYEIDIKSLEPRLLMHMNGEKYVEDIYSHFKNLLNLNAERKKIKLAVISIMYGSSLRNAENLTGINKKDLKKIYEYLKIEEWKQKLASQRKKLGYIVNPYGKKIYQDGPLINYYFQSTGADCASLAFNNMIEENFMTTEFSLLASIHDAVIVDIGWNEKSLLDKVKEVDHIYCNILDIKLPVTVKGVSNEKEV